MGKGKVGVAWCGSGVGKRDLNSVTAQRFGWVEKCSSMSVMSECLHLRISLLIHSL